MPYSSKALSIGEENQIGRTLQARKVVYPWMNRSNVPLRRAVLCYRFDPMLYKNSFCFNHSSISLIDLVTQR